MYNGSADLGKLCSKDNHQYHTGGVTDDSQNKRSNDCEEGAAKARCSASVFEID